MVQVRRRRTVSQQSTAGGRGMRGLHTFFYLPPRSYLGAAPMISRGAIPSTTGRCRFLFLIFRWIRHFLQPAEVPLDLAINRSRFLATRDCNKKEKKQPCRLPHRSPPPLPPFPTILTAPPHDVICTCFPNLILPDSPFHTPPPSPPAAEHSSASNTSLKWTLPC